MPYTIRDDIATADVCFEIEAKTLEELFRDAALATESVMVELKTVKKKIKKEIALKNENNEKLLFDFLEELIFLKDSELFLFSDFKITLKEKKATIIAFGEKINKETMSLKTDVKAITLHMFAIEKKASGWFCRIILDI